VEHVYPTGGSGVVEHELCWRKWSRNTPMGTISAKEKLSSYPAHYKKATVFYSGCFGLQYNTWMM
jgi:hypothetical protein